MEKFIFELEKGNNDYKKTIEKNPNDHLHALFLWQYDRILTHEEIVKLAEDRLTKAEKYINLAKAVPTCDYCGHDVNMWIVPPPEEEQNYDNCGNIISCSCSNCLDEWFKDKDKNSDVESIIYPECDSSGKRPITGVAIARNHMKHGYIYCVCFEYKPKMKKF